jgi:hypothetical protein
VVGKSTDENGDDSWLHHEAQASFLHEFKLCLMF